jgi:hypothetical protein
VSNAAIAYAAHTSTCTFLLDADGFCRRVVTRTKNGKESRIARRCLGAQYVASLDLLAEGGLVEMPTPGAFMLFARIDDGRVTLVKTAPLERFDNVDEPLEARPSAPELSPDPYEDDRLDARTRQVRAIRDAGVANPELSRKYQELLDRAARGTERIPSRKAPSAEIPAAAPPDDYGGEPPTMFQRRDRRDAPGGGRGMLPKRPAVLRDSLGRPRGGGEGSSEGGDGDG